MSHAPRFAFPWLTALLALGFVLAFQGSRGLWEPDEGRYVNVALQMVESGDYMVPRRNDEMLHVTKPPLVYWSIAGALDTVGHSEWAVRLPMALAFALTVAMVHLLGMLFVPARPWLPAVIYATSPLPFIAANLVTTDTLLAGFATAAVLAFALHRFGGRSPRWLDAMWVLFGLAFLTKGPPALLPLLVIVLWEWRHGHARRLLRPVGMLWGLVVAASWFLWITHHYPELTRYFLGHEVVDRVASSQMHRNAGWSGGFKVYVPTLVVGLAPWWALALWQAWRRRRTAAGAVSEAATTPDDARFLWLWAALPFVAFLLASSRLPLYILPLAVPLSLLMAQSLAARTFTWPWRIALGVWVVALVALKATSAHVANDSDSRALAARLRPMMAHPPGEVVFVETSARYGLRFYLDAEIEKVSLHPLPPGQLPSDAPYDDELLRELGEHEPGQYFLVPRDKAGAFRARLAGHGYVPQALGEAGRLAVFTIAGDGDGEGDAAKPHASAPAPTP